MIVEKDKLVLLKKVIQEFGISGSLIAVFNDIENMWYYYIGDVTLKSPTDGIHFNRILNGKCLNHIFQNSQIYFQGESVYDKIALITKINLLPEEDIRAFDFRVLQF